MRLVNRGLTNYWGYNSAVFLPRMQVLSSGVTGGQVTESSNGKNLHGRHRSDLDVVYHHRPRQPSRPQRSRQGIEKTSLLPLSREPRYT